MEINNTFLITGATGLIGSALVKKLVNTSKVIILVRNVEKARMIFKEDFSKLIVIEGDICNPLKLDDKVDYIIHAASQTSSKAFISEPVETILTSINGTKNILEFAKDHEIKSMIYLSSMEVYGAPQTDDKITEDYFNNINTMSVRSSYPESKRLCESLCKAYFSEYNVPVKVIRLTQTFGPGVNYNDNRVFAEFARCVVENREIILHTKGETKRSYLYIDDAVNAILTILLKGKNGEAYNAANESTYCSIYEMAKLITDKVVINIEDENKYGYAPILKMNLDTSKLRNLGWEPKTSLKEMYNNLINSWR